MDGSIQLSAEERKTRRKAFREARAARRAVALLPSADGWSQRHQRRGGLRHAQRAVTKDFAARARVGRKAP